MSARIRGDGELEVFPWNYGRPEFREAGRERVGSVGLTGVAHTLEAYRRLPFGWRTAPAGMPTDHHMWRQWLDLPGLWASMGERLTYLNFPDPFWKELPEDRRAEALADWLRWHAVQNVGHEEAAFINMPSQPYRHDDPDKYRLPLENDVIPYRLTRR